MAPDNLQDIMAVDLYSVDDNTDSDSWSHPSLIESEHKEPELRGPVE